MPDLVLYHALFSICSQKVRYALAKKGWSFESRIVDLSKGEHLEDWYLAINPNGVVPSLVYDGLAIPSSAITDPDLKTLDGSQADRKALQSAQNI